MVYSWAGTVTISVDQDRIWDICIRICRVGQNHTFIGIYGVYTVILAGKSPYIRSYTVCIYGSGQPYVYAVLANPIMKHCACERM